ncbi:PP2C family protein-serine/threonine phosphatase [Pectobacterium wasabiae]|uniref:PppA n=1 Tax=Pectobacterium wasabiae TaxID=55208 RepID=A0AAW3EBE6_9GAMM|nr:protein phosphatase 2C domain-containing protein [Pectobacterium wasabiae]AOR65429.1 serine/threonine phosphatase [Pectobacterium wasabiae CFBP 3304]EJS93299.1 Putative Serine/threonine specific protein phosphatase [Pectobacterium wasabiae CFBP 3304]KFX02521.1 PppA [Pectobacterium wasabiae]KGA26470.1 PppA [Pectobacterium wasabiae]
MKITIASMSNQGDRANNQDQTGDVIGERAACFVVCDGVAGFPGGDVAADIARSSLMDAFDGNAHLNAQSICNYVNHANHSIRQQQKACSEHRRMGTTLVSLFIDRDFELAYWAHAGDSRLYLFRRGYLYHVTTDHSLVQQMKDAGHQTEGINNNLLYFALGMGDEQRDASYSDVVEIEDGDAFLLCTDGFWHGVTQEQMQQSLHMVNTPEEWMMLMQQIIKNGTLDNAQQDNFSALAVWIGSPQDITLLHSLSETAQFSPLRD